MKKNLSRREFLNISSLLALSALVHNDQETDQSQQSNIVIIVFDAWSARNISLYGYPRLTTPNLTQLAERAIVYHNHYASAPWTVPGTASLLTGTHPWTHRAFTITQNQTVEEYVENNIFSQFQKAGYFTDGYSHNPNADLFLYQFGKYLDRHTPLIDLFLKSPFFHISHLPKDPNAAALALKNTYFNSDNIFSSLFLSRLLKPYSEERINYLIKKYTGDYPRGIPSWSGPGYFFRLEDSIDFIAHSLIANPKPFLGYYHLYPPHAPYSTRKEFIDSFDDGRETTPKPESVFSEGEPARKVSRARRHYDEFIAYVDAEFARLYNELENSGHLANTWLILTTDHGELFERGIIGHKSPASYEPVLHIPLFIFPPGQKERIDIYTRTSAVDILPTLYHLINSPKPATLEGEILPPFNNPPPVPNRSIFAFRPGHSKSKKPLSEGTAVIIKNDYKLIYSFGLEKLQGQDPHFELYNLNNDPEERNNLQISEKRITTALYAELKSVMEQADQKYSS